jgi:hypothetical protein
MQYYLSKVAQEQRPVVLEQMQQEFLRGRPKQRQELGLSDLSQQIGVTP